MAKILGHLLHGAKAQALTGAATLDTLPNNGGGPIDRGRRISSANRRFPKKALIEIERAPIFLMAA